MALNVYVEFTNDEMAPAGVPDAPSGFTTFPVDYADGDGTAQTDFCASRISYQGGDAGSVDPLQVTFDISSTVVQILSNSGEDGSIHFSVDITATGPALGFQPVSVSDFSSGVGGYAIILVGFSQSDDPTSTLNITTPTGFTAQSVPHNGMYVALKDSLVTPSETLYEPPSTTPDVDPSNNGTILWTIAFRAVFADADATYTGEGGILVGGGYTENPTGVKAGGEAETGHRTGGGTVLVGGSATVQKISFITDTGILTGGSAKSYVVGAIKGGVKSSGTASVSVSDNYLKPNGTVSNGGGWIPTPNVGSLNLHLNLDNSLANVGDYVTSNGENSTFRVRMQNLGSLTTGIAWSRFRIRTVGRKSAAVTGTSQISVKVYVDGNLETTKYFSYSDQTIISQRSDYFSLSSLEYTEPQLDNTELEISLPFYFGGEVDLFGMGLEFLTSFVEEGSGGSKLSGEALYSVGELSVGGVKTGLSSVIGGTTTAIPSGGLVANGVGAQQFNEEGSGGIKANGSNVTYRAFNFYGTNGILANGSFISFPSYIGRGGVDLSGEGFEGSVVDYIYNVDSSDEDFTIGGNAFASIGLPLPVGGPVAVTGMAELRLGFNYIPTGNVSVSGAVGLSIVRYSQQDFIFNIRTVQSLDKEFRWNTGDIPLSHFRVVSECLPQDPEVCQPVSDPNDVCDRKAVVTITAPTPGDVCRQLLERNFRFPILSFDKFSRPAQNSQLTLDAANGNNNLCNELTPIEFCEIPECLEFCIDFDATLLIEPDFTMSFYNARSYVASGEISVSGTATVDAIENINEYEEFGSGGIIASGSIDISASNNIYIASGNIVVQGVESGDNIKSSAYSYNHFVCPYDYEIESFTVSSQSGSIGVDWTDANKIFESDGVPAYVLLESNLYDETVSESKYLVATDLPYLVSDNKVINGIAVQIRKKGLGGLDQEIKLVGPDGIESDNKAITDDPWSSSYETYTYGSSEDTWGTNWTIEDINSEDFGIHIKVRIPSGSVHGYTQNLYIDSVKIIISVCEENDADDFELGGSADFKFNYYSVNADGGIILSNGDEELYLDYHYNAFGSLEIFGNYSQSLTEEVGSGEITVSGNLLGTDLKSSAYHYEGSSDELVVSSEFEDLNVVSSGWTYIADGDSSLDVQGSANLRLGYVLQTTGETVEILGAASKNYRYNGSGGVEIYPDIIVPEFDKLSYSYEASGTIQIEDSGATIVFSDLGIFELDILTDFSISDINVNFSETNINELTLPTDRVFTTCGDGCVDIPLSVDLNHNIVSNNKLSQFLFRNGLYMSSTFLLKYNSTNDCWQENFYFKGTGSAENNESWNLVFELKCTEVVAGVEIGKSLFQLGVSIFQNNLDTGEDYDTRIVSVFDPVSVCSGNSNLIFKLKINSKIRVASIDPNSTIHNTILYDNIGLFKNGYWYDNPEIIFNVSEVGTPITPKTIDITSFVNY